MGGGLPPERAHGEHQESEGENEGFPCVPSDQGTSGGAEN
jgi:hypothetical protein